MRTIHNIEIRFEDDRTKICGNILQDQYECTILEYLKNKFF